jgi:hypothetical protein
MALLGALRRSPSATACREAMADTVPGGNGSQAEINAAAGASGRSGYRNGAHAAWWRIESVDIN